MCKKYLFLFLVISYCALAAVAQKTKYPYSPSITNYFSDEQLDSLYKEATWQAFKANQVPRNIFNERYFILQSQIYSFSKKRINIQLAKLQNRYNKLSKIPKHALEYAEAKQKIEKIIINTISEDIPENPKLAVLLNYQASDKINSFTSDITILPDGKLKVVETIAIYNTGKATNKEYTPDGESYTIKAENNDIKRGIIRYIPYQYYWKNGLNFNTFLKIDSVTRNGQPEPFKNDAKDGAEVLYIGNPDEELSTGYHTYNIIYTLNYVLHYDKNFDELYLNVNGNGWSMPIDTVSCTIHLPQGANSISNACYTGVYGSTASKCTNVANYEKGTITFTTTAPLKKGEGLSIATSWPKGFITPPGKGELGFWIFIQNLGPLLILCIGIYLLLRAIYLLAKYRWLKPKSGGGNIIPQFDPPQNLSPAQIGYLYRMGHHQKNTIAALIDLAVYHNLEIDVQKQGNAQYYQLGAPKKTYRGLPPKHHVFEKEALLLQSETLSTQTPSKAIAYFNAVVEEYNHTFFTADYKNSKQKQDLYFYPKDKRTVKSKLLFWGGMVLSSMFMTLHYLPDVYTFAYFLGGATMAFLPTYIIKLRFWLYTQKGKKLMDEVEGFKMFLSTADAQRLNIVNRPDANLLLEKFLPYAIALDCELEWVEKFRNAIAPALELSNDGIPTYYTPASAAMGTGMILDSVVRRSMHQPYHQYMRDKVSQLRATHPQLPVYPEIEINRPENNSAKKRSWLSTLGGNTSSNIPSDRKSWGGGGSYTIGSSGSSSSSPSRGGGFSGGGASGGGGGGW